MRIVRRHGALRRLLSALAIGPTAALVIVALTGASCAKDAESRVADKPRVETAAAEKTVQPVAQDLPGAGRVMPEPGPALGAPGAAPEGASDQAEAAGKSSMGDSSYSLTLETPDALAAGSEGVARVVVTPKSGWKMNKDFPTKLTVTAPAGVRLTSKDKQSVADAERFDDHGLAFAVKFQADAAGAKAFKASLKFAVCTDATCDPKKQELAWVVNVK